MVHLLNEIAAALESGDDSIAPEVAVKSVQPSRIPEPCRSLLVHSRDMTGTLAAFWGGPLLLRPIRVRREGDELYRQVVLVRAEGEEERPVEAGAIRIYLDAFPDAARKLILGNQVPLGAILSDHSIAYVSRPRGFFRTPTNDFLRKAFPGEGDGIHYGRHNVLSTPAGRTLAEVVEILPLLDRRAIED
jgi:hypothetical protein